MIPALVLGALTGMGAFLTWRLLFPPPPSLRAAVEGWERRAGEAPSARRGSDVGGLGEFLEHNVGAPLSRLAGTLGLRLNSLEADLRLTGRTLDRHLGDKVVLGLLGLTLPSIVTTAWTVAGSHVPGTFPAALGLALGPALFFAPDLSVRSEAMKLRRSFKEALGSFLDLAVVSLAGGAGVEGALRDAAAIGDGPAHRQLRRALEATALTGEAPWVVLARLGEEVGVPELSELSASVSLAGTEGARVRDSLAVKASSLREHALADAEAEAQAATERMALPVVLLFVGFLILIGYPALDAILTGL